MPYNFVPTVFTQVLQLTAEALRAEIERQSAILLQRGPVDPKLQV